MQLTRLLTALIGLSFLFFTMQAWSEDEDRPRIDTKHYHIFDDIDLIYATKIDYLRPKIMIKKTYPRLLTDNEDKMETVETFNATVEDLMAAEINDFKKQVVDNLATQKTLSKKMQNNEMQIDFDASTINTKNADIVSVRFSFQQYIGGMAHPKHFHRVLNYNLNDDILLKLDELFKENADYLAVISTYSKKVLTRHLQNKDMIDEGTTPTMENYKNWNVKPEGLLFTFDEYQVAPYVDGTQTVLIPYSFLRGMIAKSSPIAECVFGKRKCARNNLLTGGFVDEALNTRHRGFDPLLS